jgi:hypothetical protein
MYMFANPTHTLCSWVTSFAVPVLLSGENERLGQFRGHLHVRMPPTSGFSIDESRGVGNQQVH